MFLNPSRKLFLTETSIRAVNLEMFSVYLTVSELTGLSIYSIFFFFGRFGLFQIDDIRVPELGHLHVMFL